jgi:23S rRNA (uridine2552-2'-O)-methyltransferase
MNPRGRKPNRWADHYTRKAQKENFPARSVYKLQEIQRRYRIIRTGDRVLDLGCAPGSWVKYTAALTGPTGKVLGIDLTPVQIALPAHAATLVADVNDAAVLAPHLQPGFMVVLSDMAPSTTGQRGVDAARSLGLCEAALNVAQQHLIPGGHFVCKIFQGPDFKIFADRVKALFTNLQIYKPQSSRKASREIFIIGMGKRQEA